MSKELHEALFALQGLLRGVKKDSKNPHFKNSYASLEQVADTIRPHMQGLGLYWMQMPGKIVDGSIEVTTRIAHRSGDHVDFTMEMPLAKRDPQGAGSAMTYAMRYSLMAALGLPPTDDDAETAIDRNNERDTPEAPPKSSAQLKRSGEWERVSGEIANAMNDVFTFGQFHSLKESYRTEAKKNGWNRTFLEQLGDLFLSYETDLQKRIEVENEPTENTIARELGGRIVNERITNEQGRELSPLEAAE
jgi:hypothetical protein